MYLSINILQLKDEEATGFRIGNNDGYLEHWRKSNKK